MKIYVIDFSDSSMLANSFGKQFQVFTEKLDGAIAYKQIGELMPDLIFVNYKVKPSHGKQTAQSIKGRKKTSHIPIYFVDGEKDRIEHIEHLGEAITFDEIAKLVNEHKT